MNTGCPGGGGAAVVVPLVVGGAVVVGVLSLFLPLDGGDDGMFSLLYSSSLLFPLSALGAYV